jgi:hypothetical protein
MFSVFLIMYLNNDIKTQRRLDALKIKDGISDIHVMFRVGTKQIATSSTLLFVGQTHSNLFLYNRKDSTTLIFKTAEVDSLILK